MWGFGMPEGKAENAGGPCPVYRLLARPAMTLTLNLPPETEARLQARAAAQGQDVSAYLQQLIEKDLQTQPTLDEVLAPFQAEVEQSGMSDEELDALFREAIREARQVRAAPQ